MSARELGNPLGNPLGRPRKSGEVLPGDQFTTSLYQGAGKFKIPPGFTNFEVVVVGGGAAGSSTVGGGAGAVSVKTGSISGTSGYTIDYSVGLGGGAGLSGGDSTASGSDFSMLAGGGVFGSFTGATATGGDQNYAGAVGATAEGPGVSSAVGPGSGSRSDRLVSTANFAAGGGAGYAGGNGGIGGSTPQAFGGKSTAPFSIFSGLQASPANNTVKTIASGLDGTITNGGDGGIGGGGGAAVQTTGGGIPGKGGAGLVRISFWKV